MRRQERIRFAQECLADSLAKTVFRYLAKRLPTASVFWDDGKNEAELHAGNWTIVVWSGKGARHD